MNKKKSVVDLNDYMPHVVIQGVKSVHVMPMKMLKDIATGRLKLNDTDDIDDFIPTIIDEWLAFITDG